MKLRKFIFFITIISFLVLLLIGFSYGQGGAEKTRYIIKLNNSSDLIPTAGKIKALTNEISVQKTKEEIKNKIGKQNIKGDFIDDKLSVFLTEKEKNDLIASGKIKSIQPENYVQVHLQQSRSIINSTLTNNLQINGINLTGAGQTVCIIDTGINYTHQDLGGCYGNNDPSSSCKVWGGIDWCADNTNCLTWDAFPEDVYGHGTHVAGIVAANGSITGVAPGARLIIFKACDGTGTCSDRDIRDGIAWCTYNASTFNITVISMSLGRGLFSSYCDNDASDTWDITSAINNAVQNNISVIVSTGNQGSTTQISFPACIKNVTRVGAVDKSDSIFYNRNSMVKLFAPGVNINSTSIVASGYESMSGTSMATPHVSGADAIVRQFLALTGRTKTPQQIEDSLYASGKQIIESNINYSRIDIYNTIIYLQNISSVLSYPKNGLRTGLNQTFSCNSSSYAGLKNVSFFLFNQTSLVYNSTSLISGTINSTIFSYNFTSEANYSWNCLVSDALNLSYWQTGNFSVYYDIIPPQLNIISPINSSWYNAGRFNISLNEPGNCFYSLDNGNNNKTLQTLSSASFGLVNYSFNNGNYNITYYCNDSVGNINYSYVTFFDVDITAPNVTLNGPFPVDETSNSAAKIFYFNVSDNLNVTECSLIFNGRNVSVNTSAISLVNTNNLTYSVSPGGYYWQINCTDQAGNIGNSSSTGLTINSPGCSGCGGSGGGGGGGGPTTQTSKYTVDEQSLAVGYDKDLKKSEAISFSISSSGNSESHTVTLNDIGTDYVNLTLRSNPINFVIEVGESKKFNLTSKDYFDLLVKLNGIVSGKANLTIQKINEPIITNVISLTPTNNETNIQTEEPQIEESQKQSVFVIAGEIFVVIIIICLVTYLVLKNRKHKKHSKKRKL